MPSGSINSYFSSNGHIGMGGHDIFKTAPDENEAYSSVINLKFPVNSSSDDFGMIIESDGERGYFTSNRKGGKGSDDVYGFELPPLVIFAQGVVVSFSKVLKIITSCFLNFKLLMEEKNSFRFRTFRKFY